MVGPFKNRGRNSYRIESSVVVLGTSDLAKGT